LQHEFGVQRVRGEELAPSWNVAPSQDVRIILDRTDDAEIPGRVRELRTARWGLVPFWAQDPRIGSRMINARVETLTSKPAFRRAALRRRCLVPADGYFEWTQRPGQARKQPYFLHPGEQAEPLAFGGLYEIWRNPEVPDGDPHRWLVSTTIITHSAADALGHVHDRMPLLIPTQARQAWLDPNLQQADELTQLLQDLSEPELHPQPVSTEVNNVRHDGPGLVVPVAEP
jgi:putative SOS response-associated peptidase YedK